MKLTFFKIFTVKFTHFQNIFNILPNSCLHFIQEKNLTTPAARHMSINREFLQSFLNALFSLVSVLVLQSIFTRNISKIVINCSISLLHTMNHKRRYIFIDFSKMRDHAYPLYLLLHAIHNNRLKISQSK